MDVLYNNMHKTCCLFVCLVMNFSKILVKCFIIVFIVLWCLFAALCLTLPQAIAGTRAVLQPCAPGSAKFKTSEVECHDTFHVTLKADTSLYLTSRGNELVVSCVTNIY